MKKITCLVIFVALFLARASAVSAEKVAEYSARLVNNYSLNIYEGSDGVSASYLAKKLAIIKVLQRYDSPLADYSDSFIKACVSYRIDCYLLPSITGVESYFGRYIYPNSYNPFGWGGGYMMFDDWPQAISTVAKGLRENYIDKGADTVEKISPIYATTHSWGVKVNQLTRVFESEEKKFSLFLR